MNTIQIVRLQVSFIFLIMLTGYSATYGQTARSGQKQGNTVPQTSAIKENDLKRDLFAMASDHFRGREAGTLDELKVSMWLANQARAAGLQPAGDDSTYFQFFSMWRNRISANSTIKIGDRSFEPWKDVLITQLAPARMLVPIVFMNSQSDNADLRGKAVAVMVSAEGINLNVSLPERRYPGYIFRKYSRELLERGAIAIIFIADDMGEKSWNQVKPALSRGLYDIEGGPAEQVTARVPVIWMHKNEADFIRRPGLTLNLNINIDRFQYPSVNVVGKIPGTDPVLSKEYVLYSGHQDHDGVRQPYGTDSIYNGADDNATVSVAMLAIARAFKKQPGKRSVLFVWHGAEERGLLGSRWFASNPTVPKESITAVLNGDMIGRNNGDSAALLGSFPPHLSSSDLVKMATEANDEKTRFKMDTAWDKVDHVEGWYFRSDHLPYARAGIPSVFFTSLLHPDYHTPMDDAEHIDTRKLTRMTEWMFLTGLKVANAPKRPRLEPGFKLER
jgi:hypothetical protein